LAHGLAMIIDPDRDRLHVLRLDPRQDVILFGIASRANHKVFIIT
jgi:hypothetical protein